MDALVGVIPGFEDVLAHRERHLELLELVVLGLDVVDVVAADDLGAGRFLELLDAGAHLGFVVEAVVVGLEVEVVAKDVEEGAGQDFGALDVAGDNRLGDDALHAGAGDDQTLPELPQPLEVEERIPAVLFALGVGPGNEAVKVVESGFVFGQYDLVIPSLELVFLRRGPVAGLLVGDGEVGVVVLDEVALDAEDGLDAGASASC